MVRNKEEDIRPVEIASLLAKSWSESRTSKWTFEILLTCPVQDGGWPSECSTGNGTDSWCSWWSCKGFNTTTTWTVNLQVLSSKESQNYAIKNTWTKALMGWSHCSELENMHGVFQIKNVRWIIQSHIYGLSVIITRWIYQIIKLNFLMIFDS